MDLLGKYKDMMLLEEHAKGYSEHVSIDSVNNNFIGIGENGTKIHGPILLNGHLHTNWPITSVSIQTSSIATTNLDVQRINYKGRDLEEIIRQNGIDSLIRRVDALERRVQSLESQLRG